MHWRRWVLPACAIVCLAGIYSLVRSPWWEASQALVIRNEAANNQEGPGQFRQLDDMKVNQETVLELAKSSSVLSAALADVGPPGGGTSSAWPAVADVSELRELDRPFTAQGGGVRQDGDLLSEDQGSRSQSSRAARLRGGPPSARQPCKRCGGTRRRA